MPEIVQLPKSVVNKIAAGEVIERPASVVKELMENAVDAGATRIDVTVVQGGSDLIRVSDDGCGMRADQLPLALASHATSKIRDADDLFQVATLGFRGEALASIAEVSHMRIASRTRDEPHGARIDVEGGAAQPIAPFGCPPGTTMEIRHLFFNTPVRRRFLRTTQTELGHITEAFLRIALPFPALHCTLRHGDRLIHALPPTERWDERIQACFGDEVGDRLIGVSSDDGELRVGGFVGDPACNRANNRLQYFFLNGRYIRDRSLQHALGEAYRGLLMQGRFPVAFLRWHMPADAVDVNVHPTKLEVRFRDGSRIYSQLLSAVRNRFLVADLTPRVRPPSDPVGECGPRESTRESTSPLGERGRRSRVDSAEEMRGGRLAGAPDRDIERTGIDYVPSIPPWRGAALDRGPFERSGALPGLDEPVSSASPYAAESSLDLGRTAYDAPAARTDPATGPERPTLDAEPIERREGPSTERPDRDRTLARRGMQVLRRYLVAEDDDGLLIVDQHALHERILYEQLKARLATGHIESQKLLVPEPVTLTPAESALALERQETLARLGIGVESFGGDTVLVTAYPSLLGRVSPAELVRQAVDRFQSGDGRADLGDLVDELLHMMACKAAVKAGDPLTPEEVAALLEHRTLCRDAHHCPHGRPTALVFTRGELDKRFKRV